MKKYFNKVDIVVFGTSMICLTWIILYEYNWTTDNYVKLLFYKADRIANIAYAVFTSIIASGLFYLVTIFIPKCEQIHKMKKYLASYLVSIDNLSKIVISAINEANQNQKYTLENFLRYYKLDEAEVRNDFLALYKDQNDKKKLTAFISALTVQKEYINAFILNYSKFLPINISLQITDFCNIHFFPTKVDEDLYNHYFTVFLGILNISIILKTFLNLKQ